MQSETLLGVKINPITYAEALTQIEDMIKRGGHHQVVTVNPEFVVASQKDPEFRQILNEADLSLSDGIGLVLASRLQGQSLRTRVTGTDLVEMLAKRGEELGWSFFLLGGRGSGAEAAKKLKAKYPKLVIKGLFEGDSSESGDSETLDSVRKAGKIDILLVAYGQVKQEKWISRNLAKTEAKVAIGVGGAFDYLSGQVSRAPRILRQMGLEWLYRLVREPKRAKRQLALPKFAFLVLKDRFKSPKS